MPAASARAAEYVKGFRLQVALCNKGRGSPYSPTLDRWKQTTNHRRYQ
jgi:hypothetical protein